MCSARPRAAVAARRDELADAAGRRPGSRRERTAAELRACATEEVEIQGRARASPARPSLTPRCAPSSRATPSTRPPAALTEIAGKLELPAEPAAEPLADERREELEVKIDRLARRREQLGPVNPLAKQEYDGGHRPRRGARDPARGPRGGACRAREPDQGDRPAGSASRSRRPSRQAAKNFEEVVQHLFPGGRGRLRLVSPTAREPVIGGEEASPKRAAPTRPREEAAPRPRRLRTARSRASRSRSPRAGKSMKKLSLLSGGEKSLVALAFMFAVFLAKPVPVLHPRRGRGRARRR